MNVLAYLADQNPGHDRSYGISRMSYTVLEALAATGGMEIRAITARGSQKPPPGVEVETALPWSTTGPLRRLFTDHLHPVFAGGSFGADIRYYPKGYLPILGAGSGKSVVTVHDTIVQHYSDKYPGWRNRMEYGYWNQMLRHTIGKADVLLTVSRSSERQIRGFIARHRLPEREITVTYEPCMYEKVAQPLDPPKKDSVMHLASREPHKRTSELVRWWLEAERAGTDLPELHLVGTLPDDVVPLLTGSRTLVRRPFLTDDALIDAYSSARALVFPSEIEGFGLPALEAYYLGTPVCFAAGTSTEEILGAATGKGRFSAGDPSSLFKALEEVIAMTPEEVHRCGLQLRETYSASKIAARIDASFREALSTADSP
jgi:glycosyltransferase involved in cell wall biosynthesis